MCRGGAQEGERVTRPSLVPIRRVRSTWWRRHRLDVCLALVLAAFGLFLVGANR